ncbi:glycosyltransferase [Croceitalea rosinachiae]|uniref:Glycosyltransferase n=1 Tax=Croceitalea rosinachiae TaxID=3075596 RepID=A0ABU3AD97_9FLAO|nr:glycosyltransferase [Croceitalea sp. F388]MDT0607893.1 glycosyltransferase [Croceitalea sp. F388]
MHISIVIPAHNEEKFLEVCLESFVVQTQPPEELIIVDDNSSDRTFEIATAFSKKYDWISVLQRKSSDKHRPGKKVVDAFNYGLKYVSNYNLIGKFDADIVLPSNYFEQMCNHFQSNWKLGMCSGLLYIKKDENWVYENIAEKTHIRGPIKLYHQACFNKIEGLRLGTGWDTVDTLLAKYHDFETLTDENLKVKHLRPTGKGYTAKNYQAKGEALYRMRYGLPLAKIALLKMALQAKSPKLYLQGIFSYLGAWLTRKERFVNTDEGRFIRQLRWKGILAKLF